MLKPEQLQLQEELGVYQQWAVEAARARVRDYME